MQITSATNSSTQTAQGSDPLAKIKQSFTSLGKALDAGNLSDAQKAFAQLQQNAPAQSGQNASAQTADPNNPLTSKVDALSKALSAGDLKSAQSAYADLKQTVSQGPSGGSKFSRPKPRLLKKTARPRALTATMATPRIRTPTQTVQMS
jgi:HPt (histidine-containing phosphotransfer) domain-containing protein